jgi:hypothetical protein
MEVDKVYAKEEMIEKCGAEIAKIGFAKAMKNKWIKIEGEKKDQVIRIAKDIKDEDQE